MDLFVKLLDGLVSFCVLTADVLVAHNCFTFCFGGNFGGGVRDFRAICQVCCAQGKRLVFMNCYLYKSFYIYELTLDPRKFSSIKSK